MNGSASFIPFSRTLIHKSYLKLNSGDAKNIDENSLLNFADELILNDPQVGKEINELTTEIRSDKIQIVRSIVRPLVTVVLTLSFVYLVSRLGEPKESITILLAVYGPVLGFWFGQQNLSKQPGKL